MLDPPGLRPAPDIGTQNIRSCGKSLTRPAFSPCGITRWYPARRCCRWRRGCRRDVRRRQRDGAQWSGAASRDVPTGPGRFR